VFDWKRNYRDLTALPEFSNLLIFTVGRDIAPFRFNPLVPPPGTQATVWLKKLIEIMCHAYFLGEGVSVLLLRAIDHLYRQAGLYTGRPKGYPTMADMRDYLVAYKAKGREAGWMESAMRSVETLCFGEMGTVLNSARPFDIVKLLDRRVILELDALTNADKTFLIESLLLWVHHYRMAQEDREDFKHAIFIEEAHHILLRKKQEVTGEETVTDVLLREIRELGESIICLDQHPSLISKPALGNTYTTFAFNLKHRGDIAMMQDCLHLDSEQAGYLNRLDIGWAMAKLQGRWFLPFLVKLPLVKVRKGSVTDDDVQRIAAKTSEGRDKLLSAYQSLSGVIPRRDGDSGRDAGRDKGIPPIPSEAKREKKDRKGECAIKLTTQERDFLMDVWQYATSSVTERYSRLCFSGRCGTVVQNFLLRRCFILSFSIALPRGRIKVLSLTEKGRKRLGISGGKSDRHGGAEHRYWCTVLADYLKAQGYKVAAEVPIGGGKAIDLVASRGREQIAFEVETGKADAAANAKKCVGAGMDKVVVVATSAHARDTVTKKLRSHPKVRILTGSEAMRRFGECS